ncbi:MAG: signal peptidase I [Verrucomicrobiota bacterium]|jgi:signal peptidase I
MKLRWFLSRQYRLTSDLLDEAQKRRDAQADSLPAQDLQLLDASLRDAKAALDSGADDALLARRGEDLAKAAAQWLTPYPHPVTRDNVETLLVVIALAMSIRTFFFQPFRIPTGSMQPTLFGITVKDLRDEPGFVMPGLWRRACQLVARGVIYHQAIARDDGQFDHAGAVRSFLGILNKQTFWVRYRNGDLVPVTIWGGPEESQFDSVEHRVGLVDQFNSRNRFQKGEPIIRFAETTGDHLLVDRFTYNFRRPGRGEIVVFKTGGIPQIGLDQFYIKRLIGLPGDHISIGDDRHARVNGRRLDASTPHFSRVYGFDPGAPPADSHYSGHVLDWHSRLKTSADTLELNENQYAVFGDNSVNSSDSRYWGGFPREAIIGRAWFVYWPLSSRSGFAVAR